MYGINICLGVVRMCSIFKEVFNIIIESVCANRLALHQLRIFPSVLAVLAAQKYFYI